MVNRIELIVGLGNPGAAHLTNRHNAGFWFADLLAHAHNGTFRADKRFHGEAAEVTIAGQRIRLLKPLTYMNESGRAVAAVVAYYKVPLEHLLVAYDELDLEPGRVKLKFDGGHGGHNGLRDVVNCVGSAFWRLRFGIGHPGPGRRDEVTRYVLQRASPEEETEILEAVAAAVEIIPVFLDQGEDRATTRLHSRGAEARPNGEDERTAPE